MLARRPPGKPITNFVLVLVPAFGVPRSDLDELSRKGCVVVDTTCGSVLNVWKNVTRYARDGFTALIHGKNKHEETRATASQALTLPGGRLWAIEIKRGLAPQLERGFHLACDDVRPERRLVVYGGTERFPLAEGVEGWVEDDLAFASPWGFDARDIAIPVAVWPGRPDRFVPAAHGEWLAGRIPGCEPHISVDDGHLTLKETRIPAVHEWLLARAGCCVAPFPHGTAPGHWLLEALAMGAPVVATPEAVAGLDRYESGRSFNAWLYGIARRVVANQVRSGRRQQQQRMHHCANRRAPAASLAPRATTAAL